MCNIAGYTGNKQAAPILIEMLRREQFFDGGVCTGIATIHEGKLYTTKVVGDVDVLVNTTDALNFPGTIGIAHSRPGGTLVNQAHPFTDESGNLALVLNGTLIDVEPEFFEVSQSIMQGFLDRGFTIKSAIEKNGSLKKLSNGLSYHDTEPYALYAGDKCDQGMDLCQALCEAVTAMPADIITMAIHTAEPDTIAVGKVTRPLYVGIGEDETYLATTAQAFPENKEFRAITTAPFAAVSKARPGEFTITPHILKDVRVHPITPTLVAKAYSYLEDLLKGRKDDPISIYDFGTRDLFPTDEIDCKYNHNNVWMKPSAQLTYEILWAFQMEGRLHTILGERDGKKIWKFWLD